jgi:hypothetical protein
MQEERTRRVGSERADARGARPAGGAPEGEPPSELLRQAQGWAGVANDAYAEIAKGAEAELELRRRRNRSGE